MNTYDSDFHNQAKAKLAALIIGIVVVAGLVVFIDHAQSSTKHSETVATTATATSPTTIHANSTQSNSNSTAYVDGTYTATNDYYVPHGQESIQVSLTVANGIVTSSTIQNSENDRDSAMFQEDFAAEYKSVVVGKPLANLHIHAIAGASDTTTAFNDAVSQIQNKAQN